MAPAKSVKQQKFFAMVHAKQKGELKDGSPAIKKAAKSMKKKDVKDFASTKHKGLPKKVKKKKIQEAFGQKLDHYVQIIYRWLERQEFSENEIDIILNDPNNMNIIQNAEARGTNPIIAAKEFKIEEILTSYTNETKKTSFYIQESVDYFIKKSKI